MSGSEEAGSESEVPQGVEGGMGVEMGHMCKRL